ncbi:MAG: Rne/Rng family ribonuclease [Deltaproteobacteria bacterium]|nr:Rne/Rng family ribonuclease [Deltaproteobacteria bacterium]MCB9788335.1 Rne/Rng family ribonuclease [Deltaproteobacteria bacterium]
MATAPRQLLVNCRPEQRRVALIEGGITRELYFERKDDRRLTGNIYKGRVVRVLPGMQSAFLELGLTRTAFLHVTDAYPEAARPDDGEPSGPVVHPPIGQVVREGQELLVQIAKEPLGQKGARVTTHLSLPGRHVVLRPGASQIGVSRRIADAAERARLHAMAERLCPPGVGLIVRTAAEGVEDTELERDIGFLLALWSDIERRVPEAPIPSMVHEDLDITLRCVRDLLDRGTHRVLVDDETEAQRVLDFISRFVPDFEGTIETWPGPDPLFERFGLEWEISRAVRRKVWLKSGGYIAIDHTEALTSIDVNSGRNVGKSSFEETILETNLEAAREIAYQLRLRDIGGLIVIDFIDMATEAHRLRVQESLAEALHDDRARSRVLPMSAFGLVEMTRKRARESIVQGLTEPCFYCEGRGHLRSLQVIIDSIVSRLRQLVVSGARGTLTIVAHPRVIEGLVEEAQSTISQLEREYDLQIQMAPRETQHFEHIEIE